jgi:hypothetical protein
MNTSLRKYPVEGWVTASPDFPISLIVELKDRNGEPERGVNESR